MKCFNRWIISLVVGVLMGWTGSSQAFESPLSPIAMPEIITAETPSHTPRLLFVAGPSRLPDAPARWTVTKPVRRVYSPYDTKVERINDQQ